MKYVATFISLLLFNLIEYAQQTTYTKEKQIIQVVNPGNDKDIQPNLQAAVNSAASGDEVVLPAGQFVVNKNVVITKFISVRGQGIKKTLLYRSEIASDNDLTNNSDWDGILKFNINSNTPSNIVVSDLTLKSKKPSLTEGDGLSKAEDIGINMIKCIDFVITRCRFENFGNGAVTVRHDDSLASGLIYKNEFVHNVKGVDGLGLGYGVVIYGANQKWLANPRFGSANFIFVEDNIFDYHRHSIAAGGAALYVFRYNTVNNNNIGGEWAAHAVDAHDGHGGTLGTENYFSTRAVEIYNNSIINKTFIDGKPIAPGKHPNMLVEKAICIRGGEAVIYNNYIEGYRFGVGLITMPDNFKNKSPVPYQQGYLSGLKYGTNHTGIDGEKGSGDNFIWNNNFKFYAPSNSANSFFYNYTTDYIKEGRDYHLSAKPNYKSYIYPHPLRHKLLKES